MTIDKIHVLLIMAMIMVLPAGCGTTYVSDYELAESSGDLIPKPVALEILNKQIDKYGDLPQGSFRPDGLLVKGKKVLYDNMNFKKVSYLNFGNHKITISLHLDCEQRPIAKFVIIPDYKTTGNDTSDIIWSLASLGITQCMKSLN